MNFQENLKVARSGGEIAGDTRRAIEQRTGQPVVTSQNAKELKQLITDVIEDAAALPERADGEKENE